MTTEIKKLNKEERKEIADQLVVSLIEKTQDKVVASKILSKAYNSVRSMIKTSNS